MKEPCELGSVNPNKRAEYYLKVCHPHCVRSVLQSFSVYISIYTYSHETQHLYN